MKKTILLFAAMFFAVAMNAQQVIEGEFPSLVGEKKINLKIDYSQIRIDNKSVDEWLEFRQAEQPEYNAKSELETELKPTVYEEISGAINDKLKKHNAYVVADGANYTVLVQPKDVARKGNNTNICSILDKDGNILVKFTVKGSGGHWGSMSNLWGDGYENSGKSIAKALANCFKK